MQEWAKKKKREADIQEKGSYTQLMKIPLP